MTSFPRRTFLKSLSLGASTPLLAPLVGRLEAETRGVRPMRFVFVIEGNGLPANHIQPLGIPRKVQKNLRNPQVDQSGEDALVDVSLDDDTIKLPASLEPLATFRNRLTIIQGLSGRVCGGGHSNDFGALGAYSARAGAKDITIDAAVARRVPGVFQQVALGISQSPTQDVIYGCSASGPEQKVPVYANARLAYDMLFGKVLGGNARAEAGSQQMLLDYMVDDIRRVEAQLPKEEKRKLEQYRDAFQSIAARQSKLGDIDPKRIHAATEKYDSKVETDRLRAHFDMAATALITGMTNVVTLASGAGSPHFAVAFTGLGINSDKHVLGHLQVPNAEELSIKIRRFHTELVADLMRKLQAIPEGGGTMLDNTLIIYLSDSAENHHSTCYEWPVFLLGNLGGRLKAGNRFLNYARYGIAGHRTMANLYTTLLHAVGETRDHFGQKDRELEGAVDQNGPLTELLG